jgi:hypothetical protein
MKRNFVLPSELLNKNNHDCRPETVKWKERDVIYDVSILTTLMTQGNKMINF